MKNIIPFKKDIFFKTNIDEVTSISLENTLSIKDDILSGDFIISGEYKVSEKSTTVEPFDFKIPFEIVIDSKYDTSKATVDIDDFYYEITNASTLSVSIDVLLDHLSERPLLEINRDIFDLEKIDSEEKIVNEDRCIEEEDTEDVVEEKINTIFNTGTFDNDNYVTYNIFILREGDTLDTILDKYNITEEELKKYNDLSDLKLGDKLIIPNTYERD